jgi:hypothetical protein
MSNDALCATLPYFELEGPIPYDGPCIVSTATVGSKYSPTKAHRNTAWFATWRGSTVKSPPAGGLPLRRHHSLPHPPNISTSTTPSEYSRTLLTQPSSYNCASANLQEALQLFPFIPSPPLLTPPTTPLVLIPLNSSINRTPSPLPPLTPSSSPSPTPTPSALSCSLSDHAWELWAPYLITHGGYNTCLSGPVRTVKKPRQYCLTPAKRRSEDKWMLTQILTQGKKLTRSASAKFLRCGLQPQRAIHTT